MRPISTERLGFALAGPRARELVARVANDDVSQKALPFFSIRAIDVGCAPALVARVSFTGELGFEIYVAAAYELAVYDALVRAGEDLGLVHFGGRALNALRLEKSFGAWLREYTPDYTPEQAGLARFIDFDKGDFVGRDAALRQRDEEPSHRLVTLVVDADDADAYGDEPVLADDRVVGFVTSGGYGHTVGASIALAYLEPAFADARSRRCGDDPGRGPRRPHRAGAAVRSGRRQNARLSRSRSEQPPRGIHTGGRRPRTKYITRR